RSASRPSPACERRPAIHVFLLAPYTACSRLEAVSSGPKTRKFVGLLASTSRRNSPSGLLFSYVDVPRDDTLTVYCRKWGSLSCLRSNPPLACGVALIRRVPFGARAFRCGQ